jgi:hypothetical protein
VTELLDFFLNHGLVSSLSLLVFLLCIYFIPIILDEDKASSFRARLFRVLYSISNKREHEKKYISNDINSKLNSARRELHHGIDILPKSIRVEWVTGSNGETYQMNDKDFVVRLDPSSKQEANIVRLACALVENTTMSGIRHVVEKPLAKAIDLNLIRLLLQKTNSKKAIEWFFDNEFNPVAQSDADCKAWIDKISIIDQQGLFDLIILVELEEFARKIMGVSPRPYMSGNIDRFIEFIYSISNRNLGEIVPLRLTNSQFRIGILMVGASKTMVENGIEPYMYEMNKSLSEGIRVVYSLVFDKESLKRQNNDKYQQFIYQVKELDNRITSNSKVRKDFQKRFSSSDPLGRPSDGICTRYILEDIN